MERFAVLCAALCALLPAAARAQSVEARAGVLLSLPLVRDEAAHAAIGRLLDINSNGPITIKLAPTPLVSLSLVTPLRGRTALEVGGAYGIARLVGEDQAGEWDVQNAGLVSTVLDLRYQWSSMLQIIGGVGATRFFSASTGIFAEGSNILPLLELGVAAQRALGVVTVVLDARAQTHTFGTPALRRDGGDDGNVFRLAIQLGVRGGLR